MDKVVRPTTLHEALLVEQLSGVEHSQIDAFDGLCAAWAVPGALRLGDARLLKTRADARPRLISTASRSLPGHRCRLPVHVMSATRRLTVDVGTIMAVMPGLQCPPCGGICGSGRSKRGSRSG